MCAKKTITCDVNQQGVLSPSPSGTIPVFLTKVNNPGDCPTGTISWGGCVRAFVTFDTTGTIVSGYHNTDMTLTAAYTQMSIENILPHMCN